MDVVTEVLRLPTTAETDVGPIVEHRPGEVVIRYDYEGDDGAEWATVRFSMVLASRFTPDASVSASMVQAYSRLCEIEKSSWRNELSAKATERGQGVPAAARHFLVYFDHYGCVEILAEGVAIDPGVD